MLIPPFDRVETLKGLESFSHLWLVFVFHDSMAGGWRPMVRPPRLGGRRKVGVFASRAPYRPNPIGISAVAYLGAVRCREGLVLYLQGIDLLDGTPVLDIKPYVPYADALPDARPGFATEPAGRGWEITFSETATRQIAETDPDGRLLLQELIAQILAQDPRPGYMDSYPERTDFGMRLYDLEVRWRLEGGAVRVVAVLSDLPRPR